MIKIIEGNILDAKEDIIVHQVNCKGVMGAGLAKQIRSKYPNVYNEYIKLVNTANNKKRSLMGSCQFVNTDDGKTIANIFGQNGFGRGIRQTDYASLERGLYSVYESVTWSNNSLKGKSVALPYGIGCGLAGGDWGTVYKIIDKIFKDYEVTLYKFN